MYLNMGRLGCSPLALYVLALESEASQSTMITPTQTSFNTIKHFVVVCLITQASEHEPTVSAQSTSPASFPMKPTSPSLFTPAPSQPLQTQISAPFPNPPRALPPRTLHPTPHFCLSPVCTSTSISNSTSSCRPPVFCR